MIFEATGPYNAIGKVAMQGVRAALDAGWHVTVVAHRLDESLQKHVEWLRLTVPRRLFYVQWSTARHFIRKALGNRTFDVVHAHQPQVADLADVFQCHYLTRAAHERNCLSNARTLRSSCVRLQELGVLPIEDTCYRGWKPETMMLYDSALTQNDFHRLYGRLPNEDVMVYAFPQLCFPTETERWTARQQLVGPAVRGQVLGYLGGLNDRKGWRRLVAALEGACDTFLLMGGSNSQGFEAAGMRGRMKGIGLTSDVRTFYHACDAFIVPSHYEPLGLVAFEAAAHGVPVIATEEVGALPHLLEYGTGVAWDGAEPLAPLVQSLAAQRSLSNAAAERMESELGEREYGAKLISAYQGALERKRRMGSKPLPTTAGSRCQRI